MPKSTSRRTYAEDISSENTISELKAAVGIPILDPKIYPV